LLHEAFLAALPGDHLAARSLLKLPTFNLNLDPGSHQQVVNTPPLPNHPVFSMSM
jgi:hypothetical protein